MGNFGRDLGKSVRDLSNLYRYLGKFTLYLGKSGGNLSKFGRDLGKFSRHSSKTRPISFILLKFRHILVKRPPMPTPINIYLLTKTLPTPAL